MLVPMPRAGQTVLMMEDLGAPEPSRIREPIEGQGCCELVYLAAYPPPDYDPIEEASSKIERFLRKVGARRSSSREALVEALGAALSAISPEEARGGYFEHAGYRPIGQLL